VTCRKMVLDQSHSPVADVIEYCFKLRHELVTQSHVAGNTHKPEEYVDDVRWYLTRHNFDEQASSQHSSDLENHLTTDDRWRQIKAVDSRSSPDHGVTSRNMAAGSDVSNMATLLDGGGLPTRSSDCTLNDTTMPSSSLHINICNYHAAVTTQATNQSIKSNR